MGKRPNNAPTNIKYEVVPTTLQMFDRLRKMPPCRKSDPDMITQRIDEYFRLCTEYAVQPSVEGLTVAVGVSRETLWNWQQDKTSEAGRLVDSAKNLINAMLTDATMNGKVNCVFTIWMQKNNFKYCDSPQKIEVSHTSDDSEVVQELEHNNLIWSEQLQDYILDGSGGGSD